MDVNTEPLITADAFNKRASLGRWSLRRSDPSQTCFDYTLFHVFQSSRTFSTMESKKRVSQRNIKSYLVVVYTRADGLNLVPSVA